MHHRLFALFGRQRLGRLQVEIIIQMQILESLAVNQEVQDIVTLSADLQSGFDPVQICALEELGTLERLEKGTLSLGFRRCRMQLIGHPRL